MSSRSSSLRFAQGALVLAATGLAHQASAVGTRTFDLSSMDDLAGGNLAGVSVDARGRVRASWDLGKIAVTEGQAAWGTVVLPDGSILIGTGNEGKIVRVSGGQVELFATTGQMAASAMVSAWKGDVIVGSFPNGKLYRLPAGAPGKAEAAKEWGAPIEGVEYIWALAYDDKSKSLYAATGPEGKVLRIDEQGKAQVHFDADDAHVVSLALGPDGKVYCGTAGKSILYRVDAPGRAVVLNDFDAEDVSNIAVTANGTVWATANKYGGGFSLPGKSGSGSMPGPGGARPSKAGEGQLFRIQNGVPETLLESKKTHFTALTIGDDGTPYVGAGDEGRVLTVNDDHFESIVADTEERQVQAILMGSKRRLLVTSDPIAVHEIKGEGGPDAIWTSKVLDAGLPASFGMLSWRSAGTVEFETRTGSTAEPDAAWSAWSKPLTSPNKIQSPRGRYLQLRARFGREPSSNFSEVRAHFVTDNARAIVTNVSAEGRNQRSARLSTGLSSSGGKVSQGTPKVSIKWEVENPDRDELRYRVFYRLDSQTTWRDALKPADIYTKTDFDWDTTSLPEGLYRFRVEATDELVNPPDRITKHAQESGIVVVDNTAPVFKSLAMTGRRLTGEVHDGLGPIARIELSLAGSEDWRPLAPTDGIYDEPAERFDADVSGLIPQGSRLIGVRAWDQAGNLVTKELETK